MYSFYYDINGRATLKEDGFMVDWATRAGRMVFAVAEELQEESVVTHTNLSLFWSSQGEWRRSILHKLSAYQVIHILGVRPFPHSAEDTYQAELRRRRFWACFCMDCNSAPELRSIRTLANPSSVPLPWSTSNFESSEAEELSVMLDSDPSLPCGVHASAMQGLSLW